MNIKRMIQKLNEYEDDGMGVCLGVLRTILEAGLEETHRFKKPSIAEVMTYCVERGNFVDAAKWYNHYEANGWKVGRNPMRDWKASVRTWERDTEAPRTSLPVGQAPWDNQEGRL